MPGFILVVDDEEKLLPVAESAVEGAQVKVMSVDDFVSAKRRLIQASPNLILARLGIGGDPIAGITFCKELRGHSELSSIPVILVADEIEEELIRVSTEAGVQGLVPWPISVPALLNRMKPLLPELEGLPQVEAAPPAAADEEDVSIDDKLEHAQRLLAQVLHNLKTSDLLQIVDLEDVPRVVCEITRSVCGIDEEPAQEAPQAEEKTTSMDLDSVFGLKK